MVINMGRKKTEGPCSTVVGVALPEDMRARVQRAAGKEDRPVSYWIRRAIERELKRCEKRR